MKINIFSVLGLALTVASFVYESMKGEHDKELLKKEIKEELLREQFLENKM